MALPDQIQMLISAFTFGLLFQSTIAALFLFIKGHGSILFKDRRRLVLVLFLVSAAIWAQVDFINFAVPPTSPNACQVTIIASSFFDQVARIMISGFLLWSVGHSKKPPAEIFGLCAFMAIRAVMGVIFVAYTRPQFAPVCVARSDLLVASVTVMVLDAIVIGVLAIRAFTQGFFNIMKEVRPSTKREQSKALVYCTAGLFLWTSTSFAMVIGMPSIALLLRTALPATGLMILILILTTYNGTLVLARDDDSTTPEARSPFVAPATTQASSILDDEDGSPVQENSYTRTANLFVVNPSDTPHNSAVMTYLEDVKAEDNNYTGYRSASISALQTEDFTAANPGDTGLNRASNGLLQPLSAATLEAIGSASFLATPRQGPTPSLANRVDQTRVLPRADISGTEARQKCPRFGWSKKSAKKSVHKIIISNPVTQGAESLPAQPFARMKTMDLPTAAASERERREFATQRQLVAKRPAPPPPMASEAWRNSVTTKRKEIPRGNSALPTLKSSEKAKNSSRLSVTADASSTSASLSPGREDVRRRSPRSMKTLEGDIEKACLLASRPNTIVVPKGESEQTIMYINNIIYDHPGMVQSIISEAPTAFRDSKSGRHRKSVISPKSPTTQTESIIHRARPYMRDSEQEGVFFGREPPPRQTRNKSVPSTSTMKTVWLSNPSVTGVPALSQRPTTAAGLKKLLPNETRSMSVDEKMSLLFPAPPGVSQAHSRRSSVPSLPRIPSSVLLGDSFTKMLTQEEIKEHRASKRTTISFGGQIRNDCVTPTAETPILNEHGIYRFSANTYRNLTGCSRDSRISGLTGDVQSTEQSHSNEMQSQITKSQRQSTIMGPISDAGGSPHESRSGWASINSSTPALDAITAQETARLPLIRSRKDGSAETNLVAPGIFRGLPAKSEDERKAIGDSEGFRTVMFGMSDIVPPPAKTRSFLLNQNPLIPEKEVFLSSGNDSWRNRIGDELPAFSQRRRYLRSRTMPPPPPLLLGSNRRQPAASIPVPSADQEASSELALKQIQEQLRRFDRISRESLESSALQLSDDCLKSSKIFNNDRLGLIANLEKEMGQQETFWMQMQHNFDRDSNSTTLSPQIANYSPQALPSPASEASYHKTPQRVNRKPRIQGKNDESTSANFEQSTKFSRANIWKQRLAEAEIEFNENASTLSGVGNINFLFISKVHLGSPTPPDSLNSDSDPETEIEYHLGGSRSESNAKALWKPKRSAPSVRIGLLWSVTQGIQALRTTSSEPAAKGLRPNRRRDQHSLPISSSNLWSKPTLHADQNPIGLWGLRMTHMKSIVTRPRTQKPQRKSRLVTFLPDILENPSPLPHKRDTLGIFQFPWGEKSDSAVYDPIPLPNRESLNSFVLNRTSDQEHTRPEFEPVEYSSSFFDDFEDDSEEESEVNSDDEFDESTLWEIASLLHSEDVPSRNSLFPIPRIIEDYDDDDNEDDSELDAMESISNPNSSTRVSEWPAMVKFIPIQPLKPLPPLPTSLELDDFEQTHAAARELAQKTPDPVWQAYLPALDDAVRGQPRTVMIQKPQIELKAEARVHWDKAFGAISRLPVEKALALWTLQTSSTDKQSPSIIGHETSEGSTELALWRAQTPHETIEAVDLLAVGTQSEENRTACQVPILRTNSRKPLVCDKPLPILSSQQLWTPSITPSSEYNWITRSSALAASSSLHSTSLFERSSPSSAEEFAASATAIVTSLASAKEIKGEPVLRENQGLLAAADKPTTRPASLRGSRVLASCDFWESRAQLTDCNLNRKISRSTKVELSDAFEEDQLKLVNMATKIEMSALSTGITTASIDYDSAVRHPVFFASKMVSDAVFVHPAATGYIEKQVTHSGDARKAGALWVPSSPSTSKSPRNASLWTQPASENESSDIGIQPLKGIHSRKRINGLPPLILPTGSSTLFWRPTTSTSSSTHHWLHATALRSMPPSATVIGDSPLSTLSVNTFSGQAQGPTRSEAVLEVSTLPISGHISSLTAPKRLSTLSASRRSGPSVLGEKNDQARERPPAQLEVLTGYPVYRRPSSKRRVLVDKMEGIKL